jgi:hypothetical protein
MGRRRRRSYVHVGLQRAHNLIRRQRRRSGKTACTLCRAHFTQGIQHSYSKLSFHSINVIQLHPSFRALRSPTWQGRCTRRRLRTKTFILLYNDSFIQLHRSTAHYYPGRCIHQFGRAGARGGVGDGNGRQSSLDHSLEESDH